MGCGDVVVVLCRLMHSNTVNLPLANPSLPLNYSLITSW